MPRLRETIKTAIRRSTQRSIAARLAYQDLWRRAQAFPSIDLCFAETKSLNDVVSGQNLITFTRASTGTYVGADGLIKTAAVDEPRFDHNPTTGESLGLLVEEQRTNLLLRSEEFNDASWVKSVSTVTANVIAAPDGNTTADKLVETAAAGIHQSYYSSFAYAANTTYTFSVYVKAAERFRGQLTLNTGASVFPSVITTSFNLSAKTVSATGTGASATITELSNGWFRVSLTATTSATGGTSSTLSVRLFDNAGTASYTGDGTSGIYIWGAQLEVGTFPTSYIPTTSATVTRSADVASITDANFTRWYRQDEGTMFSRTSSIAATSQRVISFNDGTTGNRILALFSNTSTSAQSIIIVSGVTQFSATRPITSISLPVAMVAAFKSADIAIAANGGSVSTQNSGSIPTVNQLQIGAESSFQANATISRLTFWSSRLPDSTLQDLTR